MSKRKETSEAKPKKHHADDGAEISDDDEILNVDFEFFAPAPDVDFHGLKMLMRQLFDNDAQLLDLSGIANLILSQPTIGSTVKVESKETDPYAFLTVLNLKEHQSKPEIAGLIKYIEGRAKMNQQLKAIADVLDSSESEVGLILTERLMNMPVEITPPTYKMLHEEITWAVEDNEPYKFSHYLLLSKTYTEVQSKLDDEDGRPQKKQKAAKSSDVFYFHPEDEILHKHAIAFGNYTYDKAGSDGDADARRTFQELGIKPQGHMILIDGQKFEAAYKNLLAAFPAPA